MLADLAVNDAAAFTALADAAKANLVNNNKLFHSYSRGFYRKSRVKLFYLP